MTRMSENPSPGRPSVARPQSPHLLHYPSFADPQSPHSSHLPSITSLQAPHPLYHPSFADRQSSHSPHPSQSIVSGASSASYHSPNSLLGNSAYLAAPSSPDFLLSAPSNGYYTRASLSSQQSSHHGAIQAPAPASNYAWTAGIESDDVGQGLYRQHPALQARN